MEYGNGVVESAYERRYGNEGGDYVPKRGYSIGTFARPGLFDDVEDPIIAGLDALVLMPGGDGTGPRGNGKQDGSGGGRGQGGGRGRRDGSGRGRGNQGPGKGRGQGGGKGGCKRPQKDEDDDSAD